MILAFSFIGALAILLWWPNLLWWPSRKVVIDYRTQRALVHNQEILEALKAYRLDSMAHDPFVPPDIQLLPNGNIIEIHEKPAPSWILLPAKNEIIRFEAPKYEGDFWFPGEFEKKLQIEGFDLKYPRK